MTTTAVQQQTATNFVESIQFQKQSVSISGGGGLQTLDFADLGGNGTTGNFVELTGTSGDAIININNGKAGSMLVLESANPAIIANTGNIRLRGRNFEPSVNDDEDYIILFYTGTLWVELARGFTGGVVATSIFMRDVEADVDLAGSATLTLSNGSVFVVTNSTGTPVVTTINYGAATAKGTIITLIKDDGTNWRLDTNSGTANNIILHGDAGLWPAGAATDLNESITFISDGTNWREVCRSG